MRVKLTTGSITDLDQNRGIGIYAQAMINRLPKLVEVVDSRQDLTHHLVFKLFSPLKLELPAVITVHDLIPLKYPAAYPLGLRGRLVWWYNRRQLQQVSGIITDSLASKKDIIQLTGVAAEKVHVIYLAVDEVFQPAHRVLKYRLPKKFVLYVGDLNWNKNIISLIGMCLKLKYPLVVVGRQAVETDFNPNHPETRELVKFQKLAKIHPKKIIRLGTVPAEDLAGIYSAATVYVQPSRDEGFGLPVLEAMSCGCPVLSSGKGSLPEITGKATLFYNQTNLKQLWENKLLRQKLAKEGLIRAKKFSWDKTIKETVKVYEKIIADCVNC